MQHALIVVDVQQGFINDFTAHIPARVLTLIDQDDFHPILFTRFVNVEGSPYRRLMEWHACEGPPETDIVPELQPLAVPDRTFDKYGHAGIPAELAGYLAEHQIERLSIAGIDTDMCVLKVAMDAFDLNIEPIVLVDCCASTSGLQSHLAGLAVLARNIGADQLRDAGLGEGRLGAPGGIKH